MRSIASSFAVICISRAPRAIVCSSSLTCNSWTGQEALQPIATKKSRRMVASAVSKVAPPASNAAAARASQAQAQSGTQFVKMEAAAVLSQVANSARDVRAPRKGRGEQAFFDYQDGNDIRHGESDVDRTSSSEGAALLALASLFASRHAFSTDQKHVELLEEPPLAPLATKDVCEDVRGGVVVQARPRACVAVQETDCEA
jgi:hypothetical protein